MKILCFPTPPFSTNTYILWSTQSCEGIIIDPGTKSFETILHVIKEHSIKPTAIWLTHSHWDHIADVARVKKALSLPVFIHKEDAHNLEFPGSDKVPMAIPPFEGVKADFFLNEGDLLPIGEVSFKVIHTPFHSPGSVCFYCEQEHILFSGDTLFQKAIGSLSLSTSEPHRLKESIKKLLALPSQTKVYPGHGPSTTLLEEQTTLNHL